MHYLYIIPIPEKSVFKIGITNNLDNRLNQHQANWKNNLWFEFDQVLYIQSVNSGKINTVERYLKQMFAEYNEGMEIAGHTEIYHITCLSNLLGVLKRITKDLKIQSVCRFNPEIRKKSVPLSQEEKDQRIQNKIKDRSIREQRIKELNEQIFKENKDKIRRFSESFEQLHNPNPFYTFCTDYYLSFYCFNNPLIQTDNLFLSIRFQNGNYNITSEVVMYPNSGMRTEINFIRRNCYRLKFLSPALWELMPEALKSCIENKLVDHINNYTINTESTSKDEILNILSNLSKINFVHSL